MSRFDNWIQSILETDIAEVYLTIDEPPSILSDRGHLVTLETKLLTMDDLFAFLHWAFPGKADLALPMNSSETFRFSGRLIDVLSTATSITIIPRPNSTYGAS